MIEVVVSGTAYPVYDAFPIAERLSELGIATPWLPMINKVTLRSGERPSTAFLLMSYAQASTIYSAQGDYNVSIRLKAVNESGSIVTKTLNNFHLSNIEILNGVSSNPQTIALCEFIDWRDPNTVHYPGEYDQDRFNVVTEILYNPLTTTHQTYFDSTTATSSTVPYTYGEVGDLLWANIINAPGTLNFEDLLDDDSSPIFTDNVYPTNLTPELLGLSTFQVYLQLIRECGYDLYVDESNEPYLAKIATTSPSLPGNFFLNGKVSGSDESILSPESIRVRCVDTAVTISSRDLGDWGHTEKLNPFYESDSTTSGVSNSPDTIHCLYLLTIDALHNNSDDQISPKNSTEISRIKAAVVAAFNNSAAGGLSMFYNAGLCQWTGTSFDSYSISFQETGGPEGPVTIFAEESFVFADWFKVDDALLLKLKMLNPVRRFNIGIVGGSSIGIAEKGAVNLAYANLYNDGGTAKIQHTSTGISVQAWNKTGDALTPSTQVILEYDYNLYAWIALPTGSAPGETHYYVCLAPTNDTGVVTWASGTNTVHVPGRDRTTTPHTGNTPKKTGAGTNGTGVTWFSIFTRDDTTGNFTFLIDGQPIENPSLNPVLSHKQAPLMVPVKPVVINSETRWIIQGEWCQPWFALNDDTGLGPATGTQASITDDEETRPLYTEVGDGVWEPAVNQAGSSLTIAVKTRWFTPIPTDYLIRGNWENGAAQLTNADCTVAPSSG